MNMMNIQKRNKEIWPWLVRNPGAEANYNQNFIMRRVSFTNDLKHLTDTRVMSSVRVARVKVFI